VTKAKPKVMAAEDFDCYRDMKDWNAAAWRLRDRGISVMTCPNGKHFTDLIQEEMENARRQRALRLPPPPPPLPPPLPLPRAFVIEDMCKALLPPPLPPLPGVPK
jgi:hypothetical protein